ncbi:upf0415 protein c7orf25 homolog [Plakobranchus ocellatus]|uniref:Upf0415 protein c7orf25 homolog n=1 Tax=Plakobranchus ocellatus TaxID=259542 RepID=A0AAV4DQ78_9GAST|nr:upf0415 protein c7orf25 homolog [Plakobranchus ocellatus]
MIGRDFCSTRGTQLCPTDCLRHCRNQTIESFKVRLKSRPLFSLTLTGKELFACETAVSSFWSILNILGGPREKERALTLLARVKVVPDQPSERAMELECHGRVKKRSKIVFGTGDSLHAITITSNMGFVRAAQGQGVVFPAFLHPARALTEEKEAHATAL